MIAKETNSYNIIIIIIIIIIIMLNKWMYFEEELDVSYGKGKELNFTLVPVIFLVRFFFFFVLSSDWFIGFIGNNNKS